MKLINQMNNIYSNSETLFDVISSLPGIFNVSSNLNDRGPLYKNYNPIKLFFDVSSTDNTGLFLLTRCCDRRYWRYGHLWKIELSVGDIFNDNNLPITYMLHSVKEIGEEAYNQSIDLIDNMNLHLNNPAFMNGYNLKKEIFIKNYISYKRKMKLNRINLYEKVLESKG